MEIGHDESLRRKRWAIRARPSGEFRWEIRNLAGLRASIITGNPLACHRLSCVLAVPHEPAGTVLPFSGTRARPEDGGINYGWRDQMCITGSLLGCEMQRPRALTGVPRGRCFRHRYPLWAMII